MHGGRTDIFWKPPRPLFNDDLSNELSISLDSTLKGKVLLLHGTDEELLLHIEGNLRKSFLRKPFLNSDLTTTVIVFLLRTSPLFLNSAGQASENIG